MKTGTTEHTQNVVIQEQIFSTNYLGLFIFAIFPTTFHQYHTTTHVQIFEMNPTHIIIRFTQRYQFQFWIVFFSWCLRVLLELFVVLNLKDWLVFSSWIGFFLLEFSVFFGGNESLQREHFFFSNLCIFFSCSLSTLLVAINKVQYFIGLFTCCQIIHIKKWWNIVSLSNERNAFLMLVCELDSVQ